MRVALVLVFVVGFLTASLSPPLWRRGRWLLGVDPDRHDAADQLPRYSQARLMRTPDGRPVDWRTVHEVEPSIPAPGTAQRPDDRRWGTTRFAGVGAVVSGEDWYVHEPPPMQGYATKRVVNRAGQVIRESCAYIEGSPWCQGCHNSACPAATACLYMAYLAGNDLAVLGTIGPGEAVTGVGPNRLPPLAAPFIRV